MRPLLDTAAVHRRDDLGVVAVAGHERLAYLHLVLSQHVAEASPGTCADYLMLDAKGTITSIGRAFIHAEEVWLTAPREVAADFAETLASRTFMMDAQVRDASAELGVVSLRGPDRIEAPGARREAMSAAPHGGGLVARGRDGDVDLIGPTDWVTRAADDLGWPQASPDDWHAWRVDAGQPAWGAEVVPGRRAQELGLLPTHVHLQKGCYPGQESIAKIHNLGRPKRALAVIDLDQPASPGDALDVAGKSGEVTSAAEGRRGPVVLGFVPLDRETGQVLGGGAVSIPDRGATGEVRHRVGEGIPQPGALAQVAQAARE